MGEGDCAGFHGGQGVEGRGKTVIIMGHQVSRGGGWGRARVGIDQGGEI